MKVADLRPGMVLGHEVRDVNGRLLMPEGVVLNERFILVLKTWGICDVSLRGESGSGAKACREDGLAARAGEIASARLMENPKDNPFICEVRQLITARVAAQLEAGEDMEPPIRLEPENRDGDLEPVDVALVISSNNEPGSMPEVLARLAQAMDNPAASPVEVAEIIMNDPGLAARLLKVVNSAMYGFPQRIDTISRAVTIIGVQQLSALALGIRVMEHFSRVDRTLINPRAFWRHSLACACGARALASLLGKPNTERFFVAGLMHDVGLLCLLQVVPDRVRQVLDAVRHSGAGLLYAERRLLGTDHTKAGASLLASWSLPESLVQAAGCHHDPLASTDPIEMGIIHVADFLAEAMVSGCSGQSVLMPVNLAALNLLGAPPGTASMVFTRVESQLSQLESIFLQNVPV